MSNPLVSVVVVTFNSALTVVETLDSIKAQSYDNIQLIITDDCSQDNTVDVCQLWIDNNKHRFVETTLVTVERNTGLCANLNRVKPYVKGEWYKGIAGDDILLPNCVEDNIKFIQSNPEARIVYSYPRVYQDYFKEANLVDRLPYPDNFFNQDVQNQLKIIVMGNFLYAPTKFYHVDISNSIMYDERYYFEDWLFNINVLKNGYKLYLLEKETIGYRKSSASMQRPKEGQIFNYKMQNAVYQIKRDVCFPYLPIRERVRTIIKHLVECWFEVKGRNNLDNIDSYNRVMKWLKKIRLV